MRSAAKAPPWAKLLRVEKSVLFSMGVRSVSSHVQQHGIATDIEGALHRRPCSACWLCDVLPPRGRQYHMRTAKTTEAFQCIVLATECRVSYWLDIPVVTPAECQRLLSDGKGTDMMSAPIQGAAGRKGAAADAHVPPAIEFGVTESGQLAVAAAPKLPDASRRQQAPLRLAMDLASLDTESVILAVAAANARIQLGEALCTNHR